MHEDAAEPLVLQVAGAAKTGEPDGLTVASARTLSHPVAATAIALAVVSDALSRAELYSRLPPWWNG